MPETPWSQPAISPPWLSGKATANNPEQRSNLFLHQEAEYDTEPTWKAAATDEETQPTERRRLQPHEQVGRERPAKAAEKTSTSVTVAATVKRIIIYFALGAILGMMFTLVTL